MRTTIKGITIIIIFFFMLPLHYLVIVDADELDTSMFGVSEGDVFTFVLERYQSLTNEGGIYTDTEMGEDRLASWSKDLIVEENNSFYIRIQNTTVIVDEEDDPTRFGEGPFIPITISNYTESVSEPNYLLFPSFVIYTDWDYWDNQINKWINGSIAPDNFIIDIYEVYFYRGVFYHNQISTDTISGLWTVYENSDSEFKIYIILERTDYIFDTWFSWNTTVDVRYEKETGVLNYYAIHRPIPSVPDDRVLNVEYTFRRIEYDYYPVPLNTTSNSSNLSNTNNKESHNPQLFDFTISTDFPWVFYLGILLMIGLAGFVGKLFWSSRKWILNRRISKILGIFLKGSPVLTLLLQSSYDDLDGEFNEEFRELIPSEIYLYKYLLHPLRLSIIKLLFDKGTLSVLELRKFTGVSADNLNKQIHSLENKGYIDTEVKFINESPTRVLHLSQFGTDRYQILSNLLLEFVSS